MAEKTPANYNIAPIFTKNGAFLIRGENAAEYVIYGATLTNSDNGVTLITPQFIDGENQSLPLDADSLTIDKNTGTIDFRANGTSYTIREFREEDGLWVSTLHMPLSVSILSGLVENDRSKNSMAMTLGSDVSSVDESLIAYAFDDSLYVVGLAYVNDLGRWLRIDGDWVKLADDDMTFDGAVPIEIDSDRSAEYLALFDSNYVPVADTEDFEAPQESTVPAQPTEK